MKFIGSTLADLTTVTNERLKYRQCITVLASYGCSKYSTRQYIALFSWKKAYTGGYVFTSVCLSPFSECF